MSQTDGAGGAYCADASLGTARARLVAALIATLAAVSVIFAPRADALVYWGNSGDGTISRATLDGTTNVQRDFITGVEEPCGVAVNSEHIYWADFQGDSIGRADIDGTGVDREFIAGVVDPCGIAIDGEHIYWSTCSDTGAVGRANIDGTGVDEDFITATNVPCGVGVDADHVYWANCDSPGGSIGRADIDGNNADVDFITGADVPCGDIAVNSSFIYWTNSGPTDAVGRAEIDGDNPDQDFIMGANNPFGVAASATNLYWINFGAGGVGQSIGRATLAGANVDQGFITAVDGPEGIAVDSLTSFPLPPNDFSFGKVKRNKKRGTASLTVEVPGAGRLELAGKGLKQQDSSVAAGTAGADAISAGAASDARLKVRAKGGKKRKLEEVGKVKVKAKVTYTPTGPTDGEPNTQTKRVKLVKRI